MPRKPVTWIGCIVILAAGVFCSWSLLQQRNNYTAADSQYNLLTAAVFFAPALALIAIFLWYYFNEKAK